MCIEYVSASAVIPHRVLYALKHILSEMIEIVPPPRANQLARILMKLERHIIAFAHTISGHTVHFLSIYGCIPV